MSEYRSIVLYHNNSPKFNETIRLNIDPENFRVCHLYFEIRHCSPKSISIASFSLIIMKESVCVCVCTCVVLKSLGR